MYKYQTSNFFSNVIKSIRPTYGNKEELAPLKDMYDELAHDHLT